MSVLSIKVFGKNRSVRKLQRRRQPEKLLAGHQSVGEDQSF